MANAENLVPFTPETAKAAQRKSMESYRRNRAKEKEEKAREDQIADAVWNILQRPVEDQKHLNMIREAGLPIDGDVTYLEFAIAAVMMRVVQKGRVSDLQAIVDIVKEFDDIGGYVPL